MTKSMRFARATFLAVAAVCLCVLAATATTAAQATQAHAADYTLTVEGADCPATIGVGDTFSVNEVLAQNGSDAFTMYALSTSVTYDTDKLELVSAEAGTVGTASIQNGAIVYNALASVMAGEVLQSPTVLCTITFKAKAEGDAAIEVTRANVSTYSGMNSYPCEATGAVVKIATTSAGTGGSGDQGGTTGDQGGSGDSTGDQGGSTGDQGGSGDNSGDKGGSTGDQGGSTGDQGGSGDSTGGSTGDQGGSGDNSGGSTEDSALTPKPADDGVGEGTATDEEKDQDDKGSFADNVRNDPDTAYNDELTGDDVRRMRDAGIDDDEMVELGFTENEIAAADADGTAAPANGSDGTSTSGTSTSTNTNSESNASTNSTSSGDTSAKSAGNNASSASSASSTSGEQGQSFPIALVAGVIVIVVVVAVAIVMYRKRNQPAKQADAQSAEERDELDEPEGSDGRPTD